MGTQQQLNQGKWTDEDKATVARLARLGMTTSEIGQRVRRDADSLYTLRVRHPELFERNHQDDSPIACEFSYYRNAAGVALPLVSIQHREMQ